MKKFLVVLCSLFSAGVFSQNITNTLGTSGLFTIKDASASYLTLNQSTGLVNILKNFRLENTSGSSIGVLYKGTERFLHNYQATGTGGNNTFLGVNSGNFTLSGNGAEASDNTGVGVNSLLSLTYGYGNVGVGNNSLRNNLGGSDNNAIGFKSLFNNNYGSYNISMGNYSLYSNTTGENNISIGYFALTNNNVGRENIAIGTKSLITNTNGNENTAVGINSSFSNVGSKNTAVGYQSLYYNSTGNYNTAIGEFAGFNTYSGNNITCIGYDSQPASVISSNQITLGNNQITSLRCNVTTITSLSDARDKKNITELSLGLDFISMLKPREFNWDKREWYDDNKSDGSKMQETKTAGFIAQELDEVQNKENADWLNLVLKDNPEKWEATYGNLLPVMVKSIQELKSENDELKNRIELLEKIVTNNTQFTNNK